ncbi:MAG: Smr/MutS family protein [Spirochaetales bacterium]|nr:Smr/MutS family protein [Spirochaetales bacterium]
MDSIRLLEFDRIRAAVAEYASCEEAAAILEGMEPIVDPVRLASRQSTVRDILTRVESGTAPPSGAVPVIRPILEEIARDGAVADGETLRDIRLFLEYAEAVRRFFSSNDGEEAPEFGTPEVPEDLLRQLKRLIRDDGAINEDAVPEIAGLRSDIRRLNRTILDAAAEMIRRDKQMYRGDQATIRDGRTVLPLAANFRGRIDGIVHEASGSGETLYVEPREIVDLNNGLVHASNAILREIQRVLRRLSALVREHIEAVNLLHARIIDADTLLARARYSVHHGGRIVPIGDRIVLKGARHPLLGSACVPLDIAFDEATRIIVVSGPNTGGKTVLLKTIGLLSMMNQSAIPVPTDDGSALPLFDYWGVDIGDEQSLDTALSTFSGHLRNLAEVCRRATAGSLILLDELGGGTDPEEAAALSMAVVDHLIEQGSTVVVTTHQTVLKHYGYTRAQAANASMAFDEASQRPTYRVVPGRPGSSHAIDTARRVGLDGAIIERALSYQERREHSVAEIINRLGEGERELSERLEAVEERARSLQERESTLADREREIAQRENELRAEGLTAINRVLGDGRRRIEAEVRRLRRQGTNLAKEDILHAQEALRELETSRDAEEEKRLAHAAESRPVDEGAPPTEGDTVVHRRTGREGVVRSVRGKRAAVQFGAIRMSVTLRELAKKQPDGADRSLASTSYHHDASVDTRPELELDIRGRRLTEALDELERQIDGAILSGLTRFSVIHGTGTGVLQKGVRDYLRSRREVRSFDFARPEEGGFGKTVVEL